VIPILVLVAIGGLMHAAGTFSSTAATSGTLLAFGYLLLVAYFAGRLVSRIGLPRLTGYLIAGVVSGPFVLELVTTTMTGKLRVVNSVATCILGLVAGAELNLERVRPIMRTIRAAMVFAVIGSMFALAALLYAMRPLLPIFDGVPVLESLAMCAVIAVALTPQSPAIVLAMLSETRADGKLSQIFLAMVVVADLVVVISYSIVAAIASAIVGTGIDIGATALAVGWELIGSIAFGIAIGMLLGLFLRTVKQGAPLFALMVCVVVAEIGRSIHLDPLIVMLAAGIWLENFARADASELIHDFESAQLPVFLVWFALAGMRLDIFQLWALIVPVTLIVVVRAVWFYLGMRIASARTQADPIVAKYGWVGLVPQAGLSLAFVVVIQSAFPTFGSFAALLLLSVLGVNQLFSPLLLRLALVRGGEVGKKQKTSDFAEHPRLDTQA
jgi:Kef-type K+ transport system membrane component KefB